jgi:hypothetical protein
MICELLFPSSILSVKLNRKTLVIVLETEIYIYDISNMRLLHVIETTPNPEGMHIQPFSHQSTYLTPYSRLCPVSFRRQFLPRLSLSNSLSDLHTRRPIHFNTTPTAPTACTPAAIRGRPAILHPLPYGRQRHPGS